MSKKSRLRAAKAKQLEQQRLFEKEEAELEKRAKISSESRAVKKYKKAAVKKEALIFKILKAVMLVPYAVNGLFFGLITVIAVLTIGLNGISDGMAYAILGADAAMTVGIVFTFLQKYIAGFVFSAGGSLLLFGVGVRFVSKIRFYMSNYYVDPENRNMDVKYMLYFYPVLLVAVCSAAMLTVVIVGKIRRRKRERDRFNNSPVKSIID